MSSSRARSHNSAPLITRKSVGSALKSLRQVDKLGHHPLAGLACVEAWRCQMGYPESVAGRGLALKGVLLTLIELLKPKEGTIQFHDKRWRPYVILSERFLKGRSASRLEAILHLARSTVDHAQAAALDTFAAHLQEVELAGQIVPYHGDLDTIQAHGRRQEDWGEARDTRAFRGRQPYLTCLNDWILGEGSRLVAIVGIGGVGKTALVEKLAKKIAPGFDRVFWRSLINAPLPGELLREWFSFFDNSQPASLPTRLDDQIDLLLKGLRHQRCLLVLDNVESVLQEGQHTGRYRDGYESYGRIIESIGERQHCSCLLLTSREVPREISVLSSVTGPVRVLPLSGLEPDEVQDLLEDRKVFGDDTAWHKLARAYTGNPLALLLIAEKIRTVFQGDLALFLAQDALLLGEVRDLLEEQFVRLSSMEQAILYWLAIEREPVSLDQMHDFLVPPPERTELIDTLSSLRNRFLIESRQERFALQNVVLEYVTNRLIAGVCNEILCGKVDLFNTHALSRATAKEYIRQSQARVILHQIVVRVSTHLGGKRMLVRQLMRLLQPVRMPPHIIPGYTAGNVLNLLSYLEWDVRGADFSYLSIQQAPLQNMRLPDVNFAHSNLRECTFAESFGPIAAVTSDPSGEFLAAGSASGGLYLWQMVDDVPWSLWQGHSDWVLALAFSPNGDILASASEDATVKLWDVQTNRLLSVFKGHVGRVRAVAFHPDGHLLASGGDDTTIGLWEIESGRLLQTIPGHSEWIRTLAFSPDGQRLASGSDDGSIRLWRREGGEWSATHYCNHGRVMDIDFHPSGHLIASGGDDCRVTIWDLDNERRTAMLAGHTNIVTSLAFSANGRLLVSSSDDHTIRVWDRQTGHCMRVLSGHTGNIRAIAFIDDNTVVSGSEDQTLRWWNVHSGRCIKIIQGQVNWIRSLAFSPSGNALAFTCYSNAIYLWQRDAGQPLAVLQKDRYHSVEPLAFSPNGHLLAVGGDDQLVHLWGMHTGRHLKSLHGHTDRVRAIAIGPKGRLLASGGSDRTIRLWDIQSGECKCILAGHSHDVMELSFHPWESTLASCSYDGTIRLWSVDTGHCLTTLHGHADWIRTVAFGPAGRLLASGSDDLAVKLWDVHSGTCMHTLCGHADRVRSVAFSPNGKLLASGSEDSTIRLWDVESGKLVQQLEGHQDRVATITFHPSGHTLASGGDDETLRLWAVDTGQCIETLHLARQYEQMNITGVQGLTEQQKTTLKALGAIERSKYTSDVAP